MYSAASFSCGVVGARGPRVSESHRTWAMALSVSRRTSSSTLSTGGALTATVGVGVGVSVDVGVSVGVGDAVGVGGAVGSGVGAGRGVTVGVGSSVGTGRGVGVALGTAVSVGAADDEQAATTRAVTMTAMKTAFRDFRKRNIMAFQRASSSTHGQLLWSTSGKTLRPCMAL